MQPCRLVLNIHAAFAYLYISTYPSNKYSFDMKCERNVLFATRDGVSGVLQISLYDPCHIKAENIEKYSNFEFYLNI